MVALSGHTSEAPGLSATSALSEGSESQRTDGECFSCRGSSVSSELL